MQGTSCPLGGDQHQRPPHGRSDVVADRLTGRQADSLNADKARLSLRPTCCDRHKSGFGLSFCAEKKLRVIAYGAMLCSQRGANSPTPGPCNQTIPSTIAATKPNDRSASRTFIRSVMPMVASFITMTASN